MYKINSKNTVLNIILISDIHYSKQVNKNVFNKLKLKFKKLKPDFICIPGDIIDESIDYDENVYDFFKYLSKISKVIIALGNHDLSKFKGSKAYYYDTKWYLKLKDIKNVYILNNEQITLNNITFTGYTTLFDSDSNYLDNPSNTLNDLNTFDFKIGNYNILLTHSPQSIMGNTKLYENEFIKNQNLILCGHMHNGMVLHVFNKVFQGHLGIIAPGKSLFPKYARGIFKFNNTHLIVSKGITKLAKHSSVLRPLNLLFPIEIEHIEIKKTEI